LRSFPPPSSIARAVHSSRQRTKLDARTQNSRVDEEKEEKKELEASERERERERKENAADYRD